MYVQSIMELVINTSKNLNSEEIPICAAIAIDKEIISIATNKVESIKSPLMHAEFIAITDALSKLNTKYLNEASIYVTLEPCNFCSSALEKIRIKNIFFGAYSTKTGAIYHGCKIFETSLHKPKIIGGIMEEKCSHIIRSYLRNL